MGGCDSEGKTRKDRGKGAFVSPPLFFRHKEANRLGTGSFRLTFRHSVLGERGIREARVVLWKITSLGSSAKGRIVNS